MVMKSFLPFAIALAAPALARAEVTMSSGPTRVALVELYTSEGCSSCPPAERWLADLARKPGLWTQFVPVAFHVNYWDHLGWRDVLASKEFTEREYAYADAWHANNVYTPCVVRSGREWSWQNHASLAEASIPAGHLVVTQLDSGGCQVAYTPPTDNQRDDLAVTVALLGSGIISKVKAGENAGRELRHEFVALQLATSAMTRAVDGSYSSVVALPRMPALPAPGFTRLALAAWVTRHRTLTPIQATGGWIK
jgi:hypothetical protein